MENTWVIFAEILLIFEFKVGLTCDLNWNNRKSKIHYFYAKFIAKIKENSHIAQNFHGIYFLSEIYKLSSYYIVLKDFYKKK